MFWCVLIVLLGFIGFSLLYINSFGFICFYWFCLLSLFCLCFYWFYLSSLVLFVLLLLFSAFLLYSCFSLVLLVFSLLISSWLTFSVPWYLFFLITNLSTLFTLFWKCWKSPNAYWNAFIFSLYDFPRFRPNAALFCKCCDKLLFQKIFYYLVIEVMLPLFFTLCVALIDEWR